jgi:demethylspheroidene O-methyltransferase
MGSGRPRSFAAYKALLTAAGFRSVREIPTPLPMVTRLMTARK